ncbi:hypothetical protein HOLleu_20027 [Holothuria leucospilota]|uniref:Uncharacterized protein n=1 Tax=Holothuria leucospilota TaxID=206669 RepID=A0A9Q1C0J5_HOLLE|nr:hypothetical protein HOLleu_20027 [Holothuria leucospilota]
MSILPKFAELGKGKEVGKLKDQTPVEMSVTSWNHYTHPSSDGERKEGTHYAEVDETSQPIAKNSSPWNGAISPSVSCKDNAQEGHEYEDANILGRQMNDGHGKTKGEDLQSNQGYEKEANRGTQNDTGYKTDLLKGPNDQTLNSVTPSDSSCAPLSARKQDGEYDSLDRQQIPKQEN